MSWSSYIWFFIKFQSQLGYENLQCCVHSVRGFPKFLVDPYYEPLSWFMIPFTSESQVLSQ